MFLHFTSDKVIIFFIPFLLSLTQKTVVLTLFNDAGVSFFD